MFNCAAAALYMTRHVVIGQSINTLFTRMDPEAARQQLLANNNQTPNAANTVSTSCSESTLDEKKQMWQ